MCHILIVQNLLTFHGTFLHGYIILLHYCNNYLEATHLHSTKSALVACRSNALLVTQLRGMFPG